MKKTITEVIRERRVYFDGAFGTMLQSRGLAPGEAPEKWNLLRPEEVEKVHREYLSAGCDILKTNTFGVNRFKYDNVKELLEAGLRCAFNATKDFPDSYIALDIGPLGRLLEPYGDLPFEEAVSVFSEIVK